MPRIVGNDIPREKRVEVALTYVYGIGPVFSKQILAKANINPDTRAKDLTDEEVAKITAIIQQDYKVEGDLRREVQQNIKRMMEIRCYRGTRHMRGLPVRGQRTSTNARTRKGKAVAIAGKKK